MVIMELPAWRCHMFVGTASKVMAAHDMSARQSNCTCSSNAAVVLGTVPFLVAGRSVVAGKLALFHTRKVTLYQHFWSKAFDIPWECFSML